MYDINTEKLCLQMKLRLEGAKQLLRCLVQTLDILGVLRVIKILTTKLSL